MDSKQTTAKTIDEFIAGYPEPVQEILQKVRQTIHSVAPDAQETINYGIPTFTLHGNLVHFAAHQKHLGFYPTPSGIEKFKDRLSKYELAKGSVKFPLSEPIPYELIEEITAFRVQENMEKAARKKQKK